MGSLLGGLTSPAPGGEGWPAPGSAPRSLLPMVHNERPSTPRSYASTVCSWPGWATLSPDRRPGGLLQKQRGSLPGGRPGRGRYGAAAHRAAGALPVEQRADGLPWGAVFGSCWRPGRSASAASGATAPTVSGPPGPAEKRVLHPQGPDEELSAALARRCVLSDTPGELPCDSELCGDRQPPCPRSWQARALQTARYERATPLWPRHGRRWGEPDAPREPPVTAPQPVGDWRPTPADRFFWDRHQRIW